MDAVLGRDGKRREADPEGPKRLAEAVVPRMDELGLSYATAHHRSEYLHIRFLDGEHAKKPGVAVRTWQLICNGRLSPNAHASTLHLVDATLKWPEGTALAYLKGRPLPDGPPLEFASSVEQARLRAEVAQLRADVAQMRAEVAELADLTDRAEPELNDRAGR